MSRKTIAIVQSNYLPWRGHFDLVRTCDAFVIGDNVQYMKQDWRNRNRIKTAKGVVWLTVPVDHAGYSEYPQLWGGFEPNVSIVDLLFNTGPCAAALIGRTEPAPPAATGDAAEDAPLR